jgi:hypothetical protein
MKRGPVLLVAYLCLLGPLATVLLAAGEVPTLGWKDYRNARFGFAVRYPADWRLGEPMPDGIGITLYPPVEGSQVALSGFMNIMEGKSQDGRQTVEEFSAAHRRIITDLYTKKNITVQWKKDADTALAGFPAKRLSFTYQDAQRKDMLELHIFSVGRNEGRGVRIKVPSARKDELMPTIDRMLASYQAGRDQNAVSPLAPKAEQR